MSGVSQNEASLASAAGYHVGMVVNAASARYDSNFTEPPPRYTEDTLIEDMLGAHKFAKNDQDRAILKETEGLGTSRTRAATIDGLIQSGLLIATKKKKLIQIVSSEAARTTVAHLPEILTSVATTAKWEYAFKLIDRGEIQPEQVRQALSDTVKFIVKTAKETGAIKLANMPQGAGQAGTKGAARPASSTGAGSSRFAAVTNTGPGGAPKASAPLAPKTTSAGAGSTGSGKSSWFK